MVVWNPINDIWNKFDQGAKKYEVYFQGRLIIAHDCLLLAQFCTVERCNHENKYNSIFEIKTKDRSLIPQEKKFPKLNDIYLKLFF